MKRDQLAKKLVAMKSQMVAMNMFHQVLKPMKIQRQQSNFAATCAGNQGTTTKKVASVAANATEDSSRHVSQNTIIHICCLDLKNKKSQQQNQKMQVGTSIKKEMNYHLIWQDLIHDCVSVCFDG